MLIWLLQIVAACCCRCCVLLWFSGLSKLPTRDFFQNRCFSAGIPHLVERAFPLLERDLFCSSSSANPTFHTREIYLDARETDIAKVLDAFNAEFSAKGVNLGSYPKWTHSYYKVSPER